MHRIARGSLPSTIALASLAGLAAAIGSASSAVAQQLDGSATTDSCAVAVEDIDGDGDADVVAADADGPVRCYVNDGSGGLVYVPDRTPPAPYRARGIALADVDGDGDRDIVVACHSERDRLLLNDGSGAFEDASSRLPGDVSATSAVCAGDVDADGDVDLIFAVFGATLQVRINDGNGHFTTANRQLVPKAKGNTACLALADVDGDGDLDVVRGNRPDAAKRGGLDELFENDGNGKFVDASKKRMPRARAFTTGVAITDLNGDGLLDLALATSGARRAKTGGRNTVHPQRNGRFPFGNKKWLDAGLDFTNAVVAGDVDGDDDVDLLFVNREDDRLFLNDGTGTFGPAPPGSLPPGLGADGRAAVLADLDGDRDLDLVIVQHRAPDRVAFNDGSGRFADRAAPAASGDAVEPDAGAPDAPTAGGLAEADPALVGAYLPRLEASDSTRAAAAAEELFVRGVDALPILVEAMLVDDPSDERQRQRLGFAAWTVRRLGRVAAPLGQELLDLLDEAASHADEPSWAEVLNSLLETTATLGPWADEAGFEVRATLQRLAQGPLATSAELARGWSRLDLDVRSDAATLIERLGSTNPFVVEFAAELLVATPDVEAAGALADAFVDRPDATAVDVEVAGRTLRLTPRPAQRDRVDDALAAALLACAPLDDASTRLRAHRHVLARARAERWRRYVGPAYRRLALESVRAVAAARALAAPAVPELTALVDPTDFPLVTSNDDELDFLHATLWALTAIGPAAADARPALEKSAKHHDPRFRSLVEQTLAALEAGTTIAPPPAASASGSAATPSPTPAGVGSARPAAPPVVDLRTFAGGKYRFRANGRETMRFESAAKSIVDGLDWLARHQSDDGRWDADAFEPGRGVVADDVGPGKAGTDVGVTGLALLCFLADGHTPNHGAHAGTVEQGVAWLLTQQQARTGQVGPRSSGNDVAIYNHLVATLALCEASGLGGPGDARLEAAVRRAVDYVLAHRSPNSGWRYGARGGEADTSVTTWAVMALAAARDLGIEVPDDALDGARGLYVQLTDPETGRCGYFDRGGRSARRAGDHAVRFPGDRWEAMTGAALFGRVLLGELGDRRATMTRGLDLLLATPPAWDRSRASEGPVDIYAWFYATHAVRHLAGRAWSNWQRALNAALTKTQAQNGAHAGSWDPRAMCWGSDGGRVYATAMAVLCLQAPYRFAPLVDPRNRLR